MGLEYLYVGDGKDTGGVYMEINLLIYTQKVYVVVPFVLMSILLRIYSQENIRLDLMSKEIKYKN